MRPSRNDRRRLHPQRDLVPKVEQRISASQSSCAQPDGRRRPSLHGLSEGLKSEMQSACAAHHAIHPRRAHPATLLLALARSPPDPACRLLRELTQAESAASRPLALGALLEERRRDTHMDSHSKSHGKTATEPACPPQYSGCGHPPCGTAVVLRLQYPSPQSVRLSSPLSPEDCQETEYRHQIFPGKTPRPGKT